jgi:glycerol-3-phosphate dehydrogenase
VFLKKASDLAEGTTKANSGIVHAGYDALPGSNKARYNARGSAMFPELVRELAVPYSNNGSLGIGFSEEDGSKLEKLMEHGKSNGIEGLALLNGDEARAICPGLTDKVPAHCMRKQPPSYAPMS